MLRVISFLFGFSLIALWAAGLASGQATGWLTWLDGVAAVFAFSVGAIGGVRARFAAGASDLVLAMGLLLLFIVGMSRGATAWQCWWTFAIAVAYAILGGFGIVTGRDTFGRTRTA